MAQASHSSTQHRNQPALGNTSTCVSLWKAGKISLWFYSLYFNNFSAVLQYPKPKLSSVLERVLSTTTSHISLHPNTSLVPIPNFLFSFSKLTQRCHFLRQVGRVAPEVASIGENLKMGVGEWKRVDSRWKTIHVSQGGSTRAAPLLISCHGSR